MFKFSSKEKARKEIIRLFELADNVFLKDQKLANKYIEFARKISMKNKVRIPRELKRKFCKKCYCYLRSGVNAKIRINKKVLVIHCESCNNITRIPFS